jgi:hypothetical protein
LRSSAASPKHAMSSGGHIPTGSASLILVAVDDPVTRQMVVNYLEAHQMLAMLAKLWRRTCGVTSESGESLKSCSQWLGKLPNALSSPWPGKTYVPTSSVRHSPGCIGCRDGGLADGRRAPHVAAPGSRRALVGILEKIITLPRRNLDRELHAAAGTQADRLMARSKPSPVRGSGQLDRHNGQRAHLRRPRRKNGPNRTEKHKVTRGKFGPGHTEF